MKHGRCKYNFETKVVDSRERPSGHVWRRRVCSKCRQRISTYEITEEEYELLMEAKQLKSELEEPAWAVVGSGGVKATGLTYAEADDLMQKLRATNDHGLSIVTAAVAERIKGNGPENA